VEAGKPTNLSIAISEHGKNVPLEVVHEMKMHLLVVNEELTWFDHIHPEEQADGSYKVSETFLQQVNTCYLPTTNRTEPRERSISKPLR
jgi:hypothetical protein